MKLLWISDLTDTGFSNASICLLKFLLRHPSKFSVNVFAINHYLKTDEFMENCRQLIPELPTENIFTIDNEYSIINSINLSNYMDDTELKEMLKEQRFGCFRLQSVLEKVKPDVVLSINDNLGLNYHKRIIEEYRRESGKKLKFICYMPIDCYNLPNNFFEELEDIDLMITMTEMGRLEILKTGYKGKVIVLPHSINTDVFCSLKNKKQLREKWIGKEHVNQFVILNSNKNQERKRLDITIRIFIKLFQRNPEKYCLVLKTGKKPSFNNGGLDIEEEISKMPEEMRRAIVVIDKKLSLEELNELYNCCDVNINTSIGEGWGIIPCEVSLCGIPQLVPDSTSYPEIFPSECLIPTIDRPRIFSTIESDIGILKSESMRVILRGFKRVKGLKTSEIKKQSMIRPIEVESYLVNESVEEEKDVLIKLNDKFIIRNLFKDEEKMLIRIKEDRPEIIQVMGINGDNMVEILKSVRGIEKSEILEELGKEYRLEILDVNNIESERIYCKVPKVDEGVRMIEELEKDRNKRIRIGRICENTIRERYDIETVGEQLGNILGSLEEEDEGYSLRITV